MNLLTVIVILLPIAAAVAALLSRSASAGSKAGYLLNAAGFGLAVILLVNSIVSDPAGLSFSPAGDETWLGLYADRLGAVLLTLVFGVGTVVQGYASRYLRGDVRQRRFFIASNLLTGATAFMVLSVTLVGLAIGWSLAGLSLVLLLGMYPGLAAADDGVRRTTIAFLVGDAALWIAVIVATLTWGSLDIRQIGSGGIDPSAEGFALTVVACLTVVAALSRSGQFPFHGWLPATVAVPTPVSAMLHAGVVNAGGILLVRMSPIFGASPEATHVAFVAGAATTIYGTALMLAKPDVKGALAHSTMGQMGFMIMTCGLGAWAAAIFHLVAHGMYKASLFLGSGSMVQRASKSAKSPPVVRSQPRKRFGVAVLSVVVPAVAIVVSARLFYPDVSSASAALLIFAWTTAAWALWGWSARKPGVLGMFGGSAVVVVATVAYLALLRIFGDFLSPDLTNAGIETVAAAWLALPAAAIAIIGLVRILPGGPRLADFRKHAYVAVLAASKPSLPSARSFDRRLGRADASEKLVPSPEGVGS